MGKETKMKYENETLVSDYYEEWNEETRMTRDKGRLIEFLTTKHYINKYLKKGDKVLEIGCGTGIYSLDMAKNGYSVTALDISNKNLDILRSKITDDMNIETANMNSISLAGIPSRKYDMTLLLGPLCHLFSEQDIDSAINEAKRVTKEDGLIFISFLTKDYIMMRNCEEIFDISVRHLNSKYEFVNNLEEVFYYFYIKEFEDLMKNHKLNRVHMLTTDGISRFVNENINNLSEEGYEKFCGYILNNCERRELMGFSPHLLYIARNTQ